MINSKASYLRFHHIGVATKKIAQEISEYALLGYITEGDFFEDPLQGIRGIFLTSESGPRLELLENLPGSQTLNVWLDRGQKFYHMAYYTDSIEQAIQYFREHCGILTISPKPSVYFENEICFMMLRNRQVIELLQA